MRTWLLPSLFAACTPFSSLEDKVDECAAAISLRGADAITSQCSAVILASEDAYAKSVLMANLSGDIYVQHKPDLLNLTRSRKPGEASGAVSAMIRNEDCALLRQVMQTAFGDEVTDEERALARGGADLSAEAALLAYMEFYPATRTGPCKIN